jgi:hypothetical protein
MPRLFTNVSGIKNETILGKTIIEAYGGTADSVFPQIFSKVQIRLVVAFCQRFDRLQRLELNMTLEKSLMVMTL